VSAVDVKSKWSGAVLTRAPRRLGDDERVSANLDAEQGVVVAPRPDVRAGNATGVIGGGAGRRPRRLEAG
jgi:hypothetical protein